MFPLHTRARLENDEQMIKIHDEKSSLHEPGSEPRLDILDLTRESRAIAAMGEQSEKHLETSACVLAARSHGPISSLEVI